MNINLNLNRRERIFITGAALFIVLFSLFHLVIAPVFEKKNQLATELAAKRRTAEEMRDLQEEYRMLVERMEISRQQYSQRPDNFSLFSFLERLADNSGIKNKIAYMRPDSTRDEVSGITLSQVEMRLEGVRMEELVPYLFRVEDAENRIHVNRLSITKSGEGTSPVNVVMRVESAEKS